MNTTVPGYNSPPVPAGTPQISLDWEDLEALLVWGTILCGDVLVSLKADPSKPVRQWPAALLNLLNSPAESP